MRALHLTCLILVLGCFAAIITTAASAQGMRTQLNGTYSFTGEQACLVSPAGFTNQVPNVPAMASTQSASTEGSMKFNADGTGTAVFTELLIAHPPSAQLFAASSKSTFSFTYTIADDGVLTITFGTVSGQFLTGPLAGITFTNEPPPMSGKVSRDGMMITLTTTAPAVETAVLGPPISVTIPRICHRSRVLIAVHVPAE